LPNNLEIKLLCHDFCKECYEFSLDDNNQMCFSCLDNYQYDFLYYNNKANINPYNCARRGYYYDIDKRQLSLCSSTDYCYYYNYTDGREICFKRDVYDNNQCPNEYQCYNGKGGYCFNSDSTSIPLNFQTGAPGAEMFACIQLINKAIDLEIEIINIFSSYTGIKNFAEKVWSVKKGASIKFVESLEKIEEKQFIKLYFSCIDSSDDNIRKAKAIAMNADRINK